VRRFYGHLALRGRRIQSDVSREEYAGKVFGFAGFGLQIPKNAVTPDYNANYTYGTDFIFQAMFAATAVTIISGAVAERIRIETFLVFAFFYLAVCYPITGMWKWGGGWLNTLDKPFYDSWYRPTPSQRCCVRTSDPELALPGEYRARSNPRR